MALKTIFVSYSHQDKRWLKRLRIHLQPYDRIGLLDLWDDDKIDPGHRWRQEIRAAIERAVASIVLVSPDFLASDFVVNEELPKLLHKAERNGARILPIIVEPCELSTHPHLAALQALNSPGRPLARMPRAQAEDVLVRAVRAVGQILSVESPVPAISEDPVSVSVAPGRDSARAPLFEELQQATITLSVLWALAASSDAELTLSDIEKTLQVRSRRRAYDALTRLEQEGWIEKRRTEGRTKYLLTNEGVRQLQRLAAASDGPVRRGMSPC